MQAFDDRLLRVTINVNGKAYVFTDINIEVSGSKYATQIANNATIKMTNIDEHMRDYIMQVTSPFLAKYDTYVMVEAGRKSNGYSVVFVGRLFRAHISEPPDITVTIKCITGFNSSVSSIYFNTTDTKTIAGEIAKKYKLILNYKGDERYINNYSLNGDLNLQIKELAKLLPNNRVFVDNNTLNVIAPKKANTFFTVNKDNGMIGVPQFTSAGVSTIVLYDPRIKIGENMEIKSEINPSLNGTYRVFKLDFNLTNRQQPFYYTIQALKETI